MASSPSSRTTAAKINLKSRKSTGKGNITAWQKMGTAQKATQSKKHPSKQKMIRAIGFFVAGRGSGKNTKKSLAQMGPAAAKKNRSAMKHRSKIGYRKGGDRASVSGGTKKKK